MLLSTLLSQVTAVKIDELKPNAAKIVQNTMYYYQKSPGSDQKGAVRPINRETSDGIQWYESGIMWGAVLEYSRVFQDPQFASIASPALALASSGKVGSFLGSNKMFANTLQGKWNDDIAWWGLATVTGAELFGKDAATKDGQSFLQISINTFNEVWQQWDTTKCGGGIYWSRDRKHKEYKSYKSTITNAQMMMLGARLTILTKDEQYMKKAVEIYKWVQKVLITPDGSVVDGIDVEKDQDCKPPRLQGLSYKSGNLIGALAWMYKASGDQNYLKEAGVLARKSFTYFVQDGIIRDHCELPKTFEVKKCEANNVQPKGTYIRGLGYLAAITNIKSDKEEIKSLLRKSYQQLIKTCDRNLNCGTYWLSGKKEKSNFHFQVNAIELVTAYGLAASKGISKKRLKLPQGPQRLETKAEDAAVTGKPTSNWGLIGLIAGAGVALLVCLVLFGLTVHKKQQSKGITSI